MAVSGGRTPWSMLRALAADELPWPQVHVVQVDERVAPAADPDRNLAHLRASLLDRAPLPPDHIYAMPVDAAALVRLREGDRSIPASRVRQDRSLVLADRAAAEQLGNKEKLEAQE